MLESLGFFSFSVQTSLGIYRTLRFSARESIGTSGSMQTCLGIFGIWTCPCQHGPETYEKPKKIARNPELESGTVTECRPNSGKNLKCKLQGCDGTAAAAAAAAAAAVRSAVGPMWALSLSRTQMIEMFGHLNDAQPLLSCIPSTRFS